MTRSPFADISHYLVRRSELAASLVSYKQTLTLEVT